MPRSSSATSRCFSTPDLASRKSTSVSWGRRRPGCPRPDGGFDVTLSTGEQRRYDAVCVANGHHWDPRWPEPAFPGAEDPNTVILSEQVRCVDWRVRRAQFIQRAPEAVLDEVVARLDALIINPEE